MNKNHTYEVNERTFYTAQVVDAYSNEKYDQTIIFEQDNEYDVPRLVDYYFGEPSVEETKYYVDRWIAAGN